ncbi:hypothetical protein [Stieleria marina]|uniref:Outer membrane efflux protein n=1 Tax=Stieleria marina TaxID=1930275 RepID=A0A517NZG7_9BACT|nr:hypothetical protein K239x_45370 [Planctomycetes bacterium K23_9]
MTSFTRPAPVLAIASIVAMGLFAGCHRQYYRKQADMEAHALIREKSAHTARPAPAPARIDIDRRSRMFNPFDLDFQPMPIDDPASHRYMQCVDGRRGYPMWEAAGVTNSVESPDWWEFLPLNEDGVLVLNAETAVQIALLHSPDYQEQLEELYLSALDVSSERFQFDTQFFGGASAFLTGSGDRRTDTGVRSTTFEIGPNSNGRRDLALQRSLATGGELIAGVANSIVWELSGPSAQSATTVLDFSLIQPLLRGAGRDRVMERLTRAERSLLANVRSFERYRRSFYLNITIGRGTESTVRRSGGVFGVGLGGFNGLGGGFAGLNGSGNAGVGGGGGVPQAGGFFGLLQDQLQIQNLEENIARLSENLLVLENTLIELLTTIPDDPEAIIRQRLQVAQAKSALLNAQSQLVSRQAAYQGSLDGFVGDLGLPPYICIKIEDPILEQFELIDRNLRSRREQLIKVRNAVGEINVALLQETESDVDPATGLPESKLDWSSSIGEKMSLLQESIEPLSAFNKKLIDDDLPRIRKDIELLTESVPERKEQNENLVELYRLERDNICTLLNVKELDESIFEIGELDTLRDRLSKDYEKLLKRLNSYTARIAKLEASMTKFTSTQAGDGTPYDRARRLRDEIILFSQDLLADMGDDVLALQLIQARARTESVILPEVEIDPATAFEIARKNRRDWANARASLVDAWRLIEFNADDLESSLDIVFTGDVQNVGNNPLSLRGSTGRLRAGLQWDAPITRLQERNTYRQSLIEYEQAKRSYYGFEDGIWQLLRGQVRQLQSNRVNFELGRQSVRIAAAQIELNEDIRSFRDARGLSSGPTAARDTISALSDLLNSQNSLLNIFVNYEVVRRGLDFDLGTMELTPEGLWIDPGKLSTDELLALPGTTNDGLIDGDCSDCCIKIKLPPEEPRFNQQAEQIINVSDVPVSTVPFTSMPNSNVPISNHSIGELPPGDISGYSVGVPVIQE